MSLRRTGWLASFLFLGLVAMAACSQETPSPTATLSPTLTATPVPLRKLTVCLGQEPDSLFPLNNSSSSARSVLAAVYDGSIDTNSYGYQPVILQRLPSIENGDAQLFPKSVYVGDEVVDASGTPRTLTLGVKLHPAGCRQDECTITFDGTSEVQMDQMQVTFRLLPGLTWSDGKPLTANDSVYAYQLAASQVSTNSRYLLDRTQSYEAADETTIQWWGKPGFIDPTYFINFWSPLPMNQWSQITDDQLPEADQSSRTPLGWGAFIIQEWVPGDHISLTKNPHYFRLDEGLPHFDILTFRFVADPAVAIADLLAGRCDLLDPSIHLDGQVAVLRSMEAQGQLQALFTNLPVMEDLALGIQPASFDNGIDAARDRVDFLGDVRVRQALAYCLDRQQVIDTVLSGLSTVPMSYLPAEHPLYDPELPSYSFNITAADQLLEQAGWMDVDQDPSTPRQAFGIDGVPSGTLFELDYVTTDAVQRQQVSSLLAASLAQCGIKVNVRYVDADTLYAPGPGGILFGRNFDLVEFAMGSSGSEIPCDWYTSSQIPDAANDWVGTNVSGYRNLSYDAACLQVQTSLPGEAAQAAASFQVQSIFANDLPVIPLYWRISTAAARADLCHFSLDPTASSSLWNIEALDAGPDCQP